MPWRLLAHDFLLLHVLLKVFQQFDEFTFYETLRIELISREKTLFLQAANKQTDGQNVFVKKPWSNSQVLAAVFVIHLQWSSDQLEPGTVYIKTTAWTENNTIYDQIISGLSNSLHYLWPHTHTHTPYLLSVSRCGLWCGWFFREASYCACVSDSSSLLSICITTTAR